MPASLLTYRRSCARRLNDIGVFGVSSSTSSTAVLFLQSNTDVNASINAFNRRWAYLSTGNGAGQSRRVRAGGWAPSTGTLTFEANWVTNPVNSDNIEITSIFPCVPEIGEDADYRTLINAALSCIDIEDRISVAIVANQDAYSLATQAGWISQDRLLRMLEPAPVSGRRPRDASWRRPEIRQDAELPYLELAVPFEASSGSLTLVVRRPADTWIYDASAGAWTEAMLLSSVFAGSAGLSEDDDLARPPVEDVTRVFLMLAAQVLMHRTTNRPQGNWADLYAAYREDAMTVPGFNAPRAEAVAAQMQQRAA